ncbi:MAG: hypothetical protein RDV48_21510 [Candidatus Eremiobacteraeota bacterium]|nr:hypothetical protein [Candidatus Eremiobacteraeota bacterium]
MSKFLKYLGGSLMLLGWLASLVGTSQAKAMPDEKKEPVKQKVDPSSPVYLQHSVSDYTLTVDGEKASNGKISPLHWNHFSHGNHYSGDHWSGGGHGSHGSHWSGW